MTKCFAVKHSDEKVRMESRSGGVFTSLSDILLCKDGAIYGCCLNNCYSVKHERAITKSQRDTFRKSKYIQSDKLDVFRQVKSDLSNKKFVLFSGTPCEIDGLNAYLQELSKSDYLYTVDILCHGVPSPLIWKRYLYYLEDLYNSEVLSVDFRNKSKFGWASHYESIKFKNGIEIDSNDYASIFYSHLCLRPSCYSCPYKSLIRISDITIADCWGIERHRADFNDNKGVSLVMLNTEKGEKLFEKASVYLDSIDIDIKNYMQMPFIRSSHVNKRKRELFWNDVKNKSFESIIKKYGSRSIMIRLKRIIRIVFPSIIIRKLKQIKDYAG